MVAVAVLIVVVIATGKIFGTATRVTSITEATSDLMQEVAAVEARLRADLARIAHDGVLVIKSNAVRNDFHGSSSPLLNPMLPPDAYVRCDQLVFFTTGVGSPQTIGIDQGAGGKPQSTSARVYYGHGFQLSRADSVDCVNADCSYVRAHDPDPTTSGLATGLLPWRAGNIGMVRTAFCRPLSLCEMYFATAGGTIDGTQPEARRWLLLRQAVHLADDDYNGPGDESKSVYLNQMITAKSLFLSEDPIIMQGRVDGCAMHMAAFREAVEWTNPNSWIGRRNRIANDLVYFPRAERSAPGTHRVDQALTNSVLASGCSSFIVEWTYDDGVGNAVNDAGFFYKGVGVDPQREQPWFGLPDADRGVTSFGQWVTGTGQGNDANETADEIAAAVELPLYQDPDYVLSTAVFGFNRDKPLDPSTGQPWAPASGIAYTPWPSALRITVVLHDPRATIETGREVQFVIRLPRRDG
jgi:hypothetical protein